MKTKEIKPIVEDKELINFHYKVKKDGIMLYGAGKFQDERLFLDKAKCTILFTELWKMLNNNEKK